MYVEDEESLHFLFRKALPPEYELLSARDGREALQIVKENPDIAIVVSDHRMPGMSGVELLGRFYRQYPEIIRILLTAYGDRETVVDAINKGHISHFLQKPWDEEELRLTLERAAESHRLNAENRRLAGELAVRNKKLEAELRRRRKVEKDLLEKEKQIRMLSQELLLAQEKERQRIGLDLHDNVAQVLSSLKFICESMLEEVSVKPANLQDCKAKVVDILQQSISAVREVSYNLQPPTLAQFGLPLSLKQYAEEMAKRHQLRLEYVTGKQAKCDIPYEMAINVYRLAQEAINNTCNHAEANWIRVELRCSKGRLLLSVADDGKGFNVKKRLKSALAEKRMGLRSMEERVGLLRGTLSIDSKPGKGCSVRVEAPFRGL
ncbi:MAG: response regulator [Deltaproteobacteria bacterium]